MTVSQTITPSAVSTTARPSRREGWLRAGTHLVAWLPFGYGLTRTWQPGWRPISDNAAIALRSWDVFSAHPPEVGQATRLGAGIFDPGPLQYWLQAIPVHIDPVHGVIWGAALCCMLACSLTIEAARAAAGRMGGLIAAGVTIGAVAWLPRIAVVPCWNPWFALMFFLAALAAGYAVLCGRRRWWPVLVAAGSVAAQAHLMFALGSALVIVVALVGALAGTARAKDGHGWLAAGLATGLACWAMPLFQEWHAKTGNLTALVHAQLLPNTLTGPGYGLRALAAATQLPPLWWAPMVKHTSLRTALGHPGWLGLLSLGVTAGVLVAAWRQRRAPRLAALAGISLLSSLTAVITLAGLPVALMGLRPTAFNDFGYLLSPVYPAGVLCWLTLAAAAALGWRAWAGRRTAQASVRRRPWISTAALTTAVAAAAIASVASIAQLPATHSPVMDETSAASRQIRQDLAGRKLALPVVCASYHITRQLTLGLTYALRTQGYQVEVSRRWVDQLGAAYQRSPSGNPLVTVRPERRRAQVRLVWPPTMLCGPGGQFAGRGPAPSARGHAGH